MGETAAQTRREIEQLRSELTEIVDELERRGRDTLDLRQQMARRPVTTGALAVGLSAAVGAVVYNLATRGREREKAPSRRGRAAEWLDLVRDRLQASRGKRERKVAHGDKTRNKEQSMLKRLLWAALSAVLVALATMLARRLSASLWQQAMHENPPGKPSEAKV